MTNNLYIGAVQPNRWVGADQPAGSGGPADTFPTWAPRRLVYEEEFEEILY